MILMSNCDPRSWFRAWMHVADLHNHKSRVNNPISIPPITDAFGEVGDITLLTTFHFNEEIYYQNYAYQFPDVGGKERPGKWLGRAQGIGDNSCSYILDTETEQLLVRSNIRSARTATIKNARYDIPLRIQGSQTECPLIDVNSTKITDKEYQQNFENILKMEPQENQELNLENIELVKPDLETKPKIYTAKDLINITVDFPVTNRNGKETTKKAVVRQQFDDDHYRLELANGKQRIIEYNQLINMINKDEEEDVERWTYESIDAHRWSKDPNRKGKVDVLISWEGYEEPTWEPMEIIKKDDPVTLAKYAIEKNLVG